MWVCSDCGGAQGESVGASSDEGLPPDPGRGRGRPGDPDEPACARERGRAGEVPPSRSSGSVDLYPAEVEPGRLRSLPGVRNNHWVSPGFPKLIFEILVDEMTLNVVCELLPAYINPCRLS